MSVALCRSLTALVQADKLLVLALQTNTLFTRVAFLLCKYTCNNIAVYTKIYVLKLMKFFHYYSRIIIVLWRDCCTKATENIANRGSNIPVIAFPPSSGSFADVSETTPNVRNITLLIN